ncbi:MAG TPA: YdcF family protein [Burkholderiaceae bacterium]|nr:YdcF family protein [Burkholderiaceae bacterium]
MGNTYSYELAALLLPPTSPLLLALLGLVLARRRLRLGVAIAGVALCIDLVLSLPVVAMHLAARLEPSPLVLDHHVDATAIVLLGGGRNRGAPEWGGETVKAVTLERTRYAAHLARATGLPLLVSGGQPNGGRWPEARLMRDVLVGEFGVTPRWIEADSLTTADNARLSASMLRRAGHARIVLVTSAIHMPRAREAFERAGLAVVEAPTGYRGRQEFEWRELVPDLDGAAELSHDALREMVSAWWYRWRARMIPSASHGSA